MEIYYIVCFFILGTIMGSFFNVVGDRLPRGKSIVFPPSHCENCNHKLGVLELIPIFSFLLQLGRCKKCNVKLSIIYPLFEICTGLSYAYSYILFGINLELLYSLIFISILLIIIISDSNYYIIPDSVLIIGLLLLIILKIIIEGYNIVFYSLIDASIAFLGLFIFKIIMDLILKKETMGGGDIKLMFLFGFVFGYKMAFILLILASFIAFPISLLVLLKKKHRVLPFGPFLNMAALNIYLLNININDLISFIKNIM